MGEHVVQGRRLSSSPEATSIYHTSARPRQPPQYIGDRYSIPVLHRTHCAAGRARYAAGPGDCTKNTGLRRRGLDCQTYGDFSAVQNFVRRPTPRWCHPSPSESSQSWTRPRPPPPAFSLRQIWYLVPQSPKPCTPSLALFPRARGQVFARARRAATRPACSTDSIAA